MHNMKPKSNSTVYQQTQHKISLLDKSKTLAEHLTSITKSDVDCVQFCLRLFQYSPNQRLTASHALMDKYYHQIHQTKSLKDLLEFNQTELNLFDSSSFNSINNENKSLQQATERTKDLQSLNLSNHVSNETQKSLNSRLSDIHEEN